LGVVTVPANPATDSGHQYTGVAVDVTVLTVTTIPASEWMELSRSLVLLHLGHLLGREWVGNLVHFSIAL
jgi:hypothetical protein